MSISGTEPERTLHNGFPALITGRSFKLGKELYNLLLQDFIIEPVFHYGAQSVVPSDMITTLIRRQPAHFGAALLPISTGRLGIVLGF